MLCKISQLTFQQTLHGLSTLIKHYFNFQVPRIFYKTKKRRTIQNYAKHETQLMKPV